MPQRTPILARSMVELVRRTRPGVLSAALFAPEPPRSMTALSAPTRERRNEVLNRLADRHAPHSRKPFQLRDDLALDIAAAIRRGKPRITDDELEATLQGFEQISREAAKRAATAREIEASVAPKAALATRLERIDDALRGIEQSSLVDQPEAVARLKEQGDLAPLLRPFGLDDAYRESVVSNPSATREVVAKALHATGVAPGRLAEIRRERDGQEQIRVQSEAAELWSELFQADSKDAPEGFAEFANRAISESMGDGDGG